MRYGLDLPRDPATVAPPVDPPLRALSLAVAQKCNLGCTYCYAQGGAFGGPARDMPLEVARQAIDQLLDGTPRGGRVNLAFLGGEPMINREVLHAATEHASERAAALGISLGLSLTTNGTLLSPADARFFERHGFAVSISLDGLGATHDRQRPYKSGRGSFARIRRNFEPFLGLRGRMQVSARVTVTPANLDLPRTLDGLLGMGFWSVGFSPMLSSPGRRGEMAPVDFDVMLEQMIACGREYERRTIAGERYAFANLATALQEIHKGSARAYPCGAGGTYLGVSAEGGLFACHRFVDEPAARLGDLSAGIDPPRRQAWLTERHLAAQAPCRDCWARQLCGGGCHHEVIHRGRPACDYIRGWLHYCLGAYVRLGAARPDLFPRLAGSG